MYSCWGKLATQLGPPRCCWNVKLAMLGTFDMRRKRGRGVTENCIEFPADEGCRDKKCQETLSRPMEGGDAFGKVRLGRACAR